jgi:simple sugar transport system ATP-binding protein
MAGISKSFQTVAANRNIHLTVTSGEILGLLGENGAGKTTLMNILYGLYSADEGTIRINGEAVRLSSPRDSIRLGIGMVHQHFMLVQNHTVAENVALGYEEASFLNPVRKVQEKLLEFSKRYGLKVDPNVKIWQLSAGEQQKVEIVKALFQGADLLILDEPTSVLTPQESEELFAVLRRMAAEGHSVIFISHKLEEVIGICDRVVVLRKGEVVGQATTDQVDKRDLARMMVGRDILFDLYKKEMKRGAAALEVEGIRVEGDRGEAAVRDVSFTIYQNEIFGIAGVSGNGQRELVEAITGLRPAAKGSIKIAGKNISGSSARRFSSAGIAHIPEERIRFGVVPNLFIYENAVLKKHHSRLFSGKLFLNYDRIKDHTRQIVDHYRISTPSISLPLKNLSGGNIQKLILGREITGDPSLLVAAHPTYGLDVGATEYIRQLLLQRRERGGAVLLVSEDLEEILELSDRVAVIFEGELMGIMSAGSADMRDIGLMMTGSKRQTTKQDQSS